MDESAKAVLIDRAKRIPIADALGIEFLGFEEGVCRARIPRNRAFDGVFETVHGGILMTFADSIACFAIMTLTGEEEIMATTDMGIRFLAPCLTDVTGVARVIKCGRTLCPVSVELFDAREKLVAVADVTYMRLPKMPERKNS